MPCLIVLVAILSVVLAQSIQQPEVLADAQTLNYIPDNRSGVFSDPGTLAYSNVELDQNQPSSGSPEEFLKPADRDEPSRAPAILSESNEISIGGGGGFGRGGTVDGEGTGGGTNEGTSGGSAGEGIGGIGRGLQGITPPEWWRDIDPPKCEEIGSDGAKKMPSCCFGGRRKQYKRGKVQKDKINQYGCRKFSSYNLDCYNAGMVFCCRQKFENNRKGIDCTREKGYPEKGATPVKAKAPALGTVEPAPGTVQPIKVPADTPNLPADRVINPQLEVPGAMEIAPLEAPIEP